MKYLATIILVVLIFLGGMWLGYRLAQPSGVTPQITSQTILESLQSKGFLVTATQMAEQKVVIDNQTGSLWKDIIWGQKITASALMRVSLGVDLTKLKPGDVKVSGNQAEITLPPVEVQSVELASDINLDNNQGVLKRLLDNNDGYNQALTQLRQQAQSAALNDATVTQARQNAEGEITRLLNFLSPQLQVRFVSGATQ